MRGRPGGAREAAGLLGGAPQVCLGCVCTCACVRVPATWVWVRVWVRVWVGVRGLLPACCILNPAPHPQTNRRRVAHVACVVLGLLARSTSSVARLVAGGPSLEAAAMLLRLQGTTALEPYERAARWGASGGWLGPEG